MAARAGPWSSALKTLGLRISRCAKSSRIKWDLRCPKSSNWFARRGVTARSLTIGRSRRQTRALEIMTPTVVSHSWDGAECLVREAPEKEEPSAYRRLKVRAILL